MTGCLGCLDFKLDDVTGEVGRTRRAASVAADKPLVVADIRSALILKSPVISAPNTRAYSLHFLNAPTIRRPNGEKENVAVQQKYTFRGLGILAVALSLGGCGGEYLDEVEGDPQAVTGTRSERSLVVTDPEILARFSFTRTINALRTTALASGERLASTDSAVGVYQRWMRSFGLGPDGCDRASIDGEGYGLQCPRPAEALLATVNPFATNPTVQFVPVGLFNRFDLMPTNGAHCGEYRIVYAMRTQAGAPLNGRAFIIFEAILPNPTPTLGVDGCLPVAQFWQGLTNVDSVTTRATRLENFFYRGTAISGFAPVVHARHFGLQTSAGPAIAGRPGQIRTNFFVNFAEWHLREFKLRKNCPTATSCQLLFDHVQVKANPAEELFSGSHQRSSAFQAAFIGQVRRLASNDLNTISMSTSNTFNEFESVSQRQDVIYRNDTQATFRTAIQNELTRIRSPLSVDNILDRATTQTCAGCHLISDNRPLGGGLTWPRSRGFVHIDEGGNLSAALTQTFIPRRLQVLEAFITARERGAAVNTAADETIAQRAADASN